MRQFGVDHLFRNWIHRDFYELNLFSVNNILLGAGFQKKKLKSIYDLDLMLLLEFIRNLEQQEHRTASQDLLLQYYSACKSRATTGTILDHSYKQVSRHCLLDALC